MNLRKTFSLRRFIRKPTVHLTRRRVFGRFERFETRQLMSADVVTQWNDTTLDAIRETGMAAPIAARTLAMVHTAVFDAVNSITQKYEPFELTHVAPPTASKEAAASTAASQVLSQIFPALATTFAAQQAAVLSTIRDGFNEDAGVHAGQLAAVAILTLRDDDGSEATASYVPGTEPGDWQPTPPGNLDALLAQWPNVAPFALTTADQFHDALTDVAIPDLNSEAYAAAYDEVRLIGAVDSSSRTDEQTAIARFWENGTGTATPPGHLNEMAQEIATARKTTMEQNALLFARLNIALADTAIAVWDTKYETDFWRPVTAIQNGDDDGNDATVADEDWTPLITTPPFPAYVSGHSAFSGAASRVLQNFFGTDNISFTLKSENTDIPDRTFTSISQAANESAISRLYGGVHWSFDNQAGLVLGDTIGNFVVTNTLATETSPVDIGVHDGVLIVVGTQRNDSIKVFPKGSRIEVTINGRRRGQFEASTIEQISIDARGGNDLVELSRIHIPASIFGGDGNDKLTGGFGDDEIYGGNGNDAIYGGRGNDRLSGDAGNDLIRGDVGNDELFGDDGNDRLFGDGGADSLEGGNGNDQLRGGSGNDVLTGDAGNDQLYGESGKDLLYGGLGDDLLVGGGQNDTLDGGPGRNKLRR